jgi:glycosyltransferase involved in cell wall biosynthesis
MYGVENYIARCADSLFAQTYPAIEFIFVDDGGKDRTVEILRGILEKQDPALQARVRIISKVNEGLPHARKTGLDAATGKYVLHVDSDDWLEPAAVEKLVREAVETEADIVVYDFWKEYPNRSKLDSERDSSAADPNLFRHRLYTYKSYGYVWNKFCRRSLYDGVFVPKYAMHEDIVFSSQILFKARKVVHLKEGLYHYDRSVSASATRESASLWACAHTSEMASRCIARTLPPLAIRCSRTYRSYSESPRYASSSEPGRALCSKLNIISSSTEPGRGKDALSWQATGHLHPRFPAPHSSFSHPNSFV